VDGGALALLEGLLLERCTVVVPTFTYFFEIGPPPGPQPIRNGYDPTETVSTMPGPKWIFNPAGTELSGVYMGAVPAAVLAHPDHTRGNHPLNSFSAVGPLALQMVGSQTPKNVYAPLLALAEAGGSVVLMGVGLERMTLLHLAEQQAGRNLFIRWANGPDGQPVAVRVGSCSDGFGRFASVLAPIKRTRQVGQSAWQVYPARAVVDLTRAAILQNPQITHCADPTCRRCDDAVQGGPLLPA
jgi:aminoglycoside 3-N-acetyltransferase